jgi:hypothetical protein
LERIAVEKKEREGKKKKSVSTQLLMSATEAAKANVGWRTIVEDDEAAKENATQRETTTDNGKKEKVADLYEAPMVDDSEAPPLE